MIVKSHLSHGHKNNEPNLIVVHAMGEYILGSGWKDHAVSFLNENGLSAHSLIAPDGTNYRCREDGETAYHAKGHNTDSLGIEFLVVGEHDYASFVKAMTEDYVTGIQYEVGLNQIKKWINQFSIERIVAHSGLSPERKVDPGAALMARLLHDIGV